MVLSGQVQYLVNPLKCVPLSHASLLDSSPNNDVHFASGSPLSSTTFIVQSIHYVTYSVFNGVAWHPTKTLIEVTSPNPELGNRVKKSEIWYLIFNVAEFPDICPCSPLNTVSNMQSG